MGVCSRRRGLLLVLVLMGLQIGGCATLERRKGALDSARSNPSLSTCECKIVGISEGRLAADELGVQELGPDGNLTRVWKVPRFTRLLRLEVADLDGDGVSEWIVLFDTGRFRSHVLRWSGAAWESSKPWAGFLRPSRGSDGSDILLGQAPGGRRFHAETISEVRLSDDGKLESGERIPALDRVFIYDFFWLPGATPRLFFLEENGSITERDPRSPQAVLWRHDERIVARPVELRRKSRDLLGEEEDERLRLAPPAVIQAGNDDGSTEVLLVTGPPTPMFAFENLRISGGGDVRVFAAGPRGLTERVRTPLLGLDVSATWVGEAHGRRLWLAAVWTKDAGGFTKPESRVFRFDLGTGNPIPWD